MARWTGLLRPGSCRFVVSIQLIGEPLDVSGITVGENTDYKERTMTTDHKHPGENDLPHKPVPQDEEPLENMEGPVDGENLNQVDPAKIRENLEEDDKGA